MEDPRAVEMVEVGAAAAALRVAAAMAGGSEERASTEGALVDAMEAKAMAAHSAEAVLRAGVAATWGMAVAAADWAERATVAARAVAEWEAVATEAAQEAAAASLVAKAVLAAQAVSVAGWVDMADWVALEAKAAECRVMAEETRKGAVEASCPRL